MSRRTCLVVVFTLVIGCSRPSQRGPVPLDDRDAASFALQKAMQAAGRDGLASLASHADPTVALHAAWELAKGDVQRTEGFLAALRSRLRVSPPAWWGACLKDIVVHEGKHHGFVGIDRTRLEADACLAYGPFDFRAEPRVAGFTFPLRAHDRASGGLLWEVEVWAAGRTVLAGAGVHRIEMLVSEGRLFVFGAESHGAYAEAFALEDGKPLLRFCTCYWFNFSEKWGL